MSASEGAGGRGERGGGQPLPAVLVVDDEPANLTAICAVLDGLGAAVVAASSGLEALRLVLREDFCAILMDVRMPDMDGYETASLIRQRERSRHIPIIFLTAYDQDEAGMFRGYAEGAVDYVFKPVQAVVLRAKVKVFIDLYDQAQKIRLQAEEERRLQEENFRIRHERLEAERQLRSTEERESTILGQLPIAVYQAQLAEKSLHRSFLHDESVRRLLGFAARDFEGGASLWLDRVHPEDREAAREGLTVRQPGESYSLEYRWRCADDSFRYFLDQGVAVAGEDGAPPRVFGTMFDVHNRRMLEQQLLHAQKIDAIGRLTGGIAHDFNNMLTVVIGNLDRLQRTDGLDTRTSRRIDHALQGALHCRDITQRLLGLARQDGHPPRAMDLNVLIHNLSDLVARTLGERIEIRQRLAPNLPQIFSDADQIESALLNLLVNARDAMPDGGTATIRTASVTVANATVDGAASAFPPGLAKGDYVMLEVSDTGVGMSAEVLERAREAFFTTKGAGKGTGLGLSTISDFARRSGGELALESSPGQGTSIRIYLPSHQGAARAQGRAGEDRKPAQQPAFGAGEVVLVVEDEEPVRRLAAGTLRELGYRVVEAGNAAAALDALAQAEKVQLLFTDIIMPGRLNGYQLAQEAARRHPGLKVLFTSAYDGDVIRGATNGDGLRLLRKPYRDHELAGAVRDALG
ncbi:MAG TPA: response regulator [Kiloniellaceae bacterium]|nr:response regulator [Kiloniellaceae bacterium]